MPYKSLAQARFAHTATAKAKGFPTAEFDRETKGYSHLPERAPSKGKRMSKRAPVQRAMAGRR